MCLLTIALGLQGCPSGSISDDDTTSSTGDDDFFSDDDATSDDDDVADDDVADDDAADDDTGDDDTTPDCHTTKACQQPQIAIQDQEQLDAILHCDTFAGALTFQDQPWLTQIDMPCLESVDDLTCEQGL